MKLWNEIEKKKTKTEWHLIHLSLGKVLPTFTKSLFLSAYSTVKSWERGLEIAPLHCFSSLFIGYWNRFKKIMSEWEREKEKFNIINSITCSLIWCCLPWIWFCYLASTRYTKRCNFTNKQAYIKFWISICFQIQRWKEKKCSLCSSL